MYIRNRIFRFSEIGVQENRNAIHETKNAIIETKNALNETKNAVHENTISQLKNKNEIVDKMDKHRVGMYITCIHPYENVPGSR